MTKTSLEYLIWFLNTYQIPPNSRIADYGGTENVGLTIVKDSLAGGGQHDYHALDFDNGVDLRLPIKGPKFDVGICMDTLEHCSNPFVVAKNIKDSLKKGAILFVTVPFVWELHYYPKDYWRFTPQGVEELFDDMYIEVIGLVRDKMDNEILPRHRIVAVFRKQKKVEVPRIKGESMNVPSSWGIGLMGLEGPQGALDERSNNSNNSNNNKHESTKPRKRNPRRGGVGHGGPE